MIGRSMLVIKFVKLISDLETLMIMKVILPPLMNDMKQKMLFVLIVFIKSIV